MPPEDKITPQPPTNEALTLSSLGRKFDRYAHLVAQAHLLRLTSDGAHELAELRYELEPYLPPSEPPPAGKKYVNFRLRRRIHFALRVLASHRGLTVQGLLDAWCAQESANTPERQ